MFEFMDGVVDAMEETGKVVESTGIYNYSGLYGILQGRAIREDAERRRISVTNRQRGYAACILARRGNHKAARRQKY